MPELLEEPIAEVKEQTDHVADTCEASGPALADETRAEPVIEFHESITESSDNPEAPALSESVSENAVVDESVAVLEEPVAVLEEPVAVLEEPVAVLEEPVAVLEEPSAVELEEPSAAVPEETGALDDEPGAALAPFVDPAEAPEVADEPIEIMAIEEVADVLAAPIAEAADLSSVDSAAEAHAVADQVAEIHDQDARVDEAVAIA